MGQLVTSNLTSQVDNINLYQTRDLTGINGLWMTKLHQDQPLKYTLSYWHPIGRKIDRFFIHPNVEIPFPKHHDLYSVIMGNILDFRHKTIYNIRYFDGQLALSIVQSQQESN